MHSIIWRWQLVSCHRRTVHNNCAYKMVLRVLRTPHDMTKIYCDEQKKIERKFTFAEIFLGVLIINPLGFLVKFKNI